MNDALEGVTAICARSMFGNGVVPLYMGISVWVCEVVVRHVTLSGVGLQHLRRLAEARERSYSAGEIKVDEYL